MDRTHSIIDQTHSIIDQISLNETKTPSSTFAQLEKGLWPPLRTTNAILLEEIILTVSVSAAESEGS
jgi:hypothetical protein